MPRCEKACKSDGADESAVIGREFIQASIWSGLYDGYSSNPNSFIVSAISCAEYGRSSLFETPYLSIRRSYSSINRARITSLIFFLMQIDNGVTWLDGFPAGVSGVRAIVLQKTSRVEELMHINYVDSQNHTFGVVWKVEERVRAQMCRPCHLTTAQNCESRRQ
ncbi:hypothetical protein TNCV_2196371 [Trichonephila clavipes]|nr:hypothetical protein TNCV_2196371 [Trichonephila clavipes]